MPKYIDDIFLKRIVKRLKIKDKMTKKDFIKALKNLGSRGKRFMEQKKTLIKYADEYFKAYKKFEKSSVFTTAKNLSKLGKKLHTM